ncbi:hypothetical protein [Baekduia alba]|uniref:hypothetical protein n=1 Tax=Baekduia alba TaxID=2997333 RepID=UPI002340EA1B|nr:hypothetical protein [Baekduia alba]
MSFAEAWAAVVETATTTDRHPVRLPHATEERRGWIEALSATRAEWEACWHGEPTAVSRMLDAFADLDDRSTRAIPRADTPVRLHVVLPPASISRALPAERRAA